MKNYQEQIAEHQYHGDNPIILGKFFEFTRFCVTFQLYQSFDALNEESCITCLYYNSNAKSLALQDGAGIKKVAPLVGRLSISGRRRIFPLYVLLSRLCNDIPERNRNRKPNITHDSVARNKVRVFPETGVSRIHTVVAHYEIAVLGDNILDGV